MRIVIAISFLLFFTWQFIGTFVHFEVSKHQIHTEVNRKIEKRKFALSTLQFTQEEFDKIIWFNQKEFKYNDTFYDIQSKTQVGNIIEIQCYNDKEEHELMNSFSKRIQTKENQNNEHHSNIVWEKILHTHYLTNQQTKIIYLNAPTELQKREYNFYQKHLAIAHLQSIIKPPILIS